MLETSKDVLFLVIALGVLLFTIFICWVLFYLAMILKQTNQIITDFRKKVEDIDQLLATIKEKVIASTTSITVIAKGVAKLIEHFTTKKEKSSKKK